MTLRRRPEHMGSILEPISQPASLHHSQKSVSDWGWNRTNPFVRARGPSQNELEKNKTKTGDVTTQGGSSHGLPHRHFLRSETQI